MINLSKLNQHAPDYPVGWPDNDAGQTVSRTEFIERMFLEIISNSTSWIHVQ